MARKIYVTWQPEIAEAGDYFLTVIEPGDVELTLDQIMSIAHGIEGLDEDSYDLCSVLDTTGDTTIIY